MSKSSGEFLRLQLLIDRGYHPLAYRLMCLQAHYRSELEFSWENLGAALTRLKRMLIAAERLAEVAPVGDSHPKLAPMLEAFDTAISDDLATPMALTALEDVLAAKKVDAGAKPGLGGTDGRGARARPVRQDPAPTCAFGPRRLRSRKTKSKPRSTGARRHGAEKDFATSDVLRDELASRGVEVMDGDPLGWEWKTGVMTLGTIAVLTAAVRPFIESRLPSGIEPVWFDTPEQLLDLAPRAEIGWFDAFRSDVVPEAVCRAENLRWLSTVAAGVDHLPLALMAQRRTVLTNGAGLHAGAVAEYAVLGMLDVAKGYRAVVRAQDRHEWLHEPPGQGELAGTSALIVGAGAIGGRIANLLRAFDVAVTEVRRSGAPGTLRPDAWRARLGAFDWVIVAVPSTPDTRGMIGTREFAAMKPGAVILNLARGEVIDTAALLESIDSGRLGGAFLDVTDPRAAPARASAVEPRNRPHFDALVRAFAEDDFRERRRTLPGQLPAVHRRRTARPCRRSRRGVLGTGLRSRC